MCKAKSFLNFLQIILGGGRQVFEAANDTGEIQWPCKRGDNLDLIEAWKADKVKRGKSHLFLGNRNDLLNADLDNTDFIMGMLKSKKNRFNKKRNSQILLNRLVLDEPYSIRIGSSNKFENRRINSRH